MPIGRMRNNPGREHDLAERVEAELGLTDVRVLTLEAPVQLYAHLGELVLLYRSRHQHADLWAFRPGVELDDDGLYPAEQAAAHARLAIGGPHDLYAASSMTDDQLLAALGHLVTEVAAQIASSDAPDTPDTSEDP